MGTSYLFHHLLPYPPGTDDLLGYKMIHKILEDIFWSATRISSSLSPLVV